MPVSALLHLYLVDAAQQHQVPAFSALSLQCFFCAGLTCDKAPHAVNPVPGSSCVHSHVTADDQCVHSRVIAAIHCAHSGGFTIRCQLTDKKES